MKRALASALCACAVAASARADELPAAPGAAERDPLAGLFDVSIAPAAGLRKVSWRDRISPGLASYSSGGFGLLELRASVYPLANRMLVLGDLGLFGSTGRSLRAHLGSPDGLTSLDALLHEWEAGLRWRLVLNGDEYGGASIRYASLRDDFTGLNAGNAFLPGCTLQYWQPGLDFRLPLGPVALALEGGYLALVVQDAIGRAFPRASGRGVQARAAVSVALPAHLEVRLEGRYTRFFYSLHPLPNDPWVAGGALDEYATLELALAVRP